MTFSKNHIIIGIVNLEVLKLTAIVINAGGCLLVKQNFKGDLEFLLVQEKSLPYSNLWNFPIGRSEQNESIISCTKRETEEETGFQVKLSYLIGIYQQPVSLGNVDAYVTAFVFAADIVEGELTIPKDLLDVKWFTLEGIHELDRKKLLLSPYILHAIRRWSHKDSVKIPLEAITVID